MNIICKLKKELERAKIARATLKKLWDGNKFKNFVVEFELKDKSIYEKIPESKKAILEKMIDLFYANYFKLFISGFFPISFNTVGKEAVTFQQQLAKYEKIQEGMLLNDKLGRMIKLDLIFRASGKQMYLGNPIRFKLKKRNYLPLNFVLILKNVSISLDLLMEFLQEIKRDFLKKKASDIYIDILDAFIEGINEVNEIEDYNNELLFSNNVNIYLYYNLDFSFSATSDTVKVIFRKVGVFWEKRYDFISLHIYKPSYMGEFYDNIRESIGRLSDWYGLQEEEMDKKIYFILYELSQRIISYWAKEKTLSSMFLNNLWELAEKLMNNLYRLDDNQNYKIDVIEIKDDIIARRPLTKNKIVINILEAIYAKKSKFREINNKLYECYHKAKLEGKDILHITLNKNIGYGGSGEFSIFVSYYDSEIDKTFIMILISLQHGIEDGKEYHNIRIHTHPFFYNLDKNKLARVYSDPSISVLLELLGLSRHDLYLLLRKIETEFFPLDF